MCEFIGFCRYYMMKTYFNKRLQLQEQSFVPKKEGLGSPFGIRVNGSAVDILLYVPLARSLLLQSCFSHRYLATIVLNLKYNLKSKISK